MLNKFKGDKINESPNKLNTNNVTIKKDSIMFH